jgi:hydrogenase nickel incorporation protein HypA/HybF
VHELSVCESLFAQATRIAGEQGGMKVERVTVIIGPLSGVEPSLLAQAFTIARSAAGCPDAELEIETPPIIVACGECGARSEAASNRLVCGECGDWRVTVASGAELILKRVDLLDATAEILH